MKKRLSVPQMFGLVLVTFCFAIATVAVFITPEGTMNMAGKLGAECAAVLIWGIIVAVILWAE